ncbi:unnamed protein product [Rhizophagus irregularis]|uniref:Uncharacterized protein n=1 Tax=Rhizophagus irregularis TaxID=588596 RepID=A0A915Z8L8_9GLOM|nr:unnamed protein product [Rhizophagus irregularis]
MKYFLLLLFIRMMIFDAISSDACLFEVFNLERNELQIVRKKETEREGKREYEYEREEKAKKCYITNV